MYYLWKNERYARVDPLSLVAEFSDTDQFKQISSQLIDLEFKRLRILQPQLADTIYFR